MLGTPSLHGNGGRTSAAAEQTALRSGGGDWVALGWSGLSAGFVNVQSVLPGCFGTLKAPISIYFPVIVGMTGSPYARAQTNCNRGADVVGYFANRSQ